MNNNIITCNYCMLFSMNLSSKEAGLSSGVLRYVNGDLKM